MSVEAPKRRKSIPLLVKLHAALYQLGLEPHACDLDHEPALGLRAWDEEKRDTVPPANDPRFLIWRPRPGHKTKTFARKGESQLSGSDGDIQRIRRLRRLSKDQEEFQRRLLAKETGEARPKSRRWPKRKFPKRGKR